MSNNSDSSDSEEDEETDLDDSSEEEREQSELLNKGFADAESAEINHVLASSSVSIKISPSSETSESAKKLQEFVSGQNKKLEEGIRGCLKRMSLQSYNRLLYRSDEEERIETGGGAYFIPNYGALPYCGLQGLVPLLKLVQASGDLDHPLYYNLREGDWMCDYICNRLKGRVGTKDFAGFLTELLEPIKGLQKALKPTYFDAVINRVYGFVEDELMIKLKPALLKPSALMRGLLLSSVSFVGSLDSAPLAPLCKSILVADGQPSSLAAGHPYTAISYWRNWGRDTFLAMPGLLLIPGRFDDARFLILSYAGALRHGLIPNLLIEGTFARYNCRDAVWWWLYAITKYIEMAPSGEKILYDDVLRMYPDDNTLPGTNFKEEKLHLTMLEALNRHFKGIEFRERNAGREIDALMNDEGFNVKVWVDHETGFIFGGNAWNCGTWMNKMGSSEAAGNRGVPSTPRDGAAVELQGIAFRVLEELNKLHAKKAFPHSGVTDGSTTWTWKAWASHIQKNFERRFFVEDDDPSPLVQRRGIVKDSVNSSSSFTDYQLRPNFVVTLALAPKVISAAKAWRALNLAEEILLGPLGIKTLDPKDLNYCGYYDIHENSSDRRTAQGFNFHQGPEWLWLAMYFLRAKMTVAGELKDNEAYKRTLESVRSRLDTYWEQLQKSSWSSLPEFTNENGTSCPGACGAKASSVGCLIELLDQFDKHH